jgi:molybdopterin converting factor small subunit
MKVKVQCLGQLGRLAGGAVDVELAGDAAVRGLLSALSLKFGDEFRRIALDDTCMPRASLLVLVNGTTADKKSNVALKDGDEVKLLPAIAGG